MRRLKWILAVFLLAAIPASAWAGTAHGQQFSVVIEQDQVVRSSVYSTGQEVRIKGTIFGDVYCAGQNVRIEATVYGDVLCAGMDVTINGKVEGDVRVAGQLVSIGGVIGKNVTAAAMNFSLDAEAAIGQDLTAKGEVLNIKGAVGRDIVANGQTIDLKGTVGRNVQIDGAQLRLKDDARIGGNLTYTSPRQAEISKKATVEGKTHHHVPKRGGFNFVLYLFAVTSLTLIGMVLAYLFPRFLHKTTAQIEQNLSRTMLVGTLGSLALLGIMVGLLISFVGVPLTAALLVAGALAAILSGPITAYYVGTLVLWKRKNASPILMAFVGGVIVVTLYHLPFFGLLFVVTAFWLGFGALLLTIKPYVGNKTTARQK